MLKKICGRCGRSTKQGERCSCINQRHKEYDRMFRDRQSQQFYNSKEWRELSKLCRVRANGLDEYELKVNKRIVKGALAHHIEEVKENENRKLDIDNLIWLSERTHSMIHREYNKNNERKKEIKQILFEIVNKRIRE